MTASRSPRWTIYKRTGEGAQELVQGPDTETRVEVCAAAETQRIIRAGDELARSLASTPGIDPMRSVLLKKWREAKSAF